MSRAIGLTLTIAGLALAIGFGQGLLGPQLPQSSCLIVVATVVAIAMVSAGARYRHSMTTIRPNGL
jgi:hypothetical protein